MLKNLINLIFRRTDVTPPPAAPAPEAPYKVETPPEPPVLTERLPDPVVAPAPAPEPKPIKRVQPEKVISAPVITAWPFPAQPPAPTTEQPAAKARKPRKPRAKKEK